MLKNLNLSSRHATYQKHLRNVASSPKQPTLTSMASVSGQSTLDANVKEGEIRLAAFVVEHNLPINVMTHLPQLMQSVCKDSSIARKIASSRTKTTKVIKNVIGKSSRQDLINVMKENKFSLIIDESTDQSCIKHMCIVARVRVDNKVMDAFFGLVPIDDATAQSLYNHVVKAMTDVGIPYKENLIGLAADGANVMMGKHNSLSSRLKEDILTLLILKCVCHSFHLCASYACLTLPRSVEGLARDVYNYLSSSPKRTSELKEFQIFVDIKPHKLLHPSQTRWLSLHMVVSRLLEQFEALILYFTNAVWEDRILAAQSILDNLKDPRNRLYLEFLDFILPYFNNLNKQMQAESPQIYTLHEAVCKLCRTLMDCYKNEDYLRKTSVDNVQYQRS
ncbi:zinc finger protein 862-like [Macrobrachium rosenbergii]|uniref:zinc finger protein 862-like n=1 Tax=Macrobrachium rosenbergii TaxID=79674 RepID=UPI0034D666CF